MNLPYKVGLDDSPLIDIATTAAPVEVILPHNFVQAEVFLTDEQLLPDLAAGVHGLPDVIPVEVKTPYKITSEG